MRTRHTSLSWALALTFHFIVQSHGALAAPPLAPKFENLPPAERARLDRQRALIAGLVKQRYGTRTLTKTKSDLPALQRLLDDHVFSRTQTYELQSLGVAFGDVLASELGLSW